MQREAEKPAHNRTVWGKMVDRSLKMWRFTLRLPHYVVKFIGFKLQQVAYGHPSRAPIPSGSHPMRLHWVAVAHRDIPLQAALACALEGAQTELDAEFTLASAS